jgi:hypothetical protein
MHSGRDGGEPPARRRIGRDGPDRRILAIDHYPIKHVLQ